MLSGSGAAAAEHVALTLPVSRGLARLPGTAVARTGYRRRVVASASAGAAAGGNGAADAAPGGSNYWTATLSLTKAIIGAGMMPIPHAFNLLGWVAAVGMLLAVAVVTYWTKAVLVEGSAVTGESSYASLTARLVGPAGAGLLQSALFGFCFGVMAVYLVVIGDVLAGAPGAANGLITEVAGITSGPLLSRANVIMATAALACAPLVSVRDITKLGAFNAAGVAAVALLAGTAALLGIVAVLTGAAHPLPAAPNLAALGDSPLRIAMGLAGIVPIILNCYVGHQSVHGIMAVLQPYSADTMKSVCAGALGLGAVLFMALGLGGVTAFGPATSANILVNMSAAGMAPLLGTGPAQVLSILVRGGFAVSLLGSFALLMHPLRTCLVELLWRRRLAAAGPGPSAAAAAAAITNKYYVPLTYGILLAAVATAVLVPDIWAALSVVGDLASTIQAFVVPGLIGLALVAGRGLAPGSGPKSGGGSSSSDSNSGQALQRVIAAGVLVLGVALFGNGVLQRVMA